MIYVIEITYYNKSTQEIVDLLKIGYTRDDNRDKRLTQYKLHNPLYTLLYEIPECDEEIEKSLHQYFKVHQYQEYGTEWFIYSDEIIEFFDRLRTKDDIVLELNNHLFSYGKTGNRVETGFNKVVSRLIDTCLNIKYPGETYDPRVVTKEKEVILGNISELKIITIEGAEKFILGHFGYSMKYLEEFYIPPSQKISEFLDEFETLDNFHDKMKLICESSMTEEELSFILTQVPVSYKNYYLKLGPSRLYALGYNITYVKREYSDAINFDSDQLKLELCKYFEVGKIYSFSDAKEIIKTVYNSLGYNKTSRANDLEQYFEVKEKKITNKETGKRDHCYEILKIKN